ncbi:hypothetical protein [Sphingomicrobium sediminis]|uniref:DUF304 domain-containing protein n=1 Tax=Sphingomicrobium sediminis TaxID=2950949 RepID=A0A9X2EGT4_9SPHN|nr:hypothetical protein [Sphingomicrobium sediminis]MCM8557748.1 hypothetical protein [Sphingomicrobium sediminis]
MLLGLSMQTIGPDPLYAALRDELEIGESLRWWGRPVKGPAIVWGAFAIWLFAVPWTAFAVFWTYMAAAGMSTMPSEGMGDILKYAFPAFGLPFIFVGLGMMAAPFFAGRAERDTIYGVSDRRVIRLQGKGRKMSVTSIAARQIGPVIRSERQGVGKLKIQTHSYQDDGDRRTGTFDLNGLADARKVERLVRELGRSVDPAAPREPANAA